MDFALSTEQQDLADAERSWLVKHDPILARRESIDDVPAPIPAAARKHVVESGLASLLTDEVGATHVDLLVIVEAHGWAGSALPVAELAIAAAALEAIDDPHWAEVAAGEQVAIPVLSPRTDSLAVEVVGGGLRLRGTTAPAAGLADAERIVLLARTADGTDVAAAIPVADAGIRMLDTLDLTRSWGVADLDCTVADWAELPAGESSRLADQLATHRAIDALGAADRLLQMTVDYAGQRTQFDRPIGSFQAVKHHLANMALGVEASRSVLWAAAVALDEEDGPDGAGTRARAVSAAVAYACKATSQVAQLALQVHGGIGFTWEHDVHLLIRRIKVDELLDGSVADHRRRLVALS
ncbi:acyl-CoA dehydrogenase family protein [Gordonia sp. ABSL1-1]|uniref:acyl-CoA dehydrogenase family protein n=1 Tax=Gordonia sp. ABSL1-1 TaxID=3053923 RepID=UPI00257382E2|nr:acyl-CoA dehydrogenase family protein [Gordonia sp. ABSL1-1]MDL9938066.1 acyl-CoA dehydrogenase family protein [Gordonia sp. ABSL1-1]